MQSYPLFRKENIPSYMTVLLAWALIACGSALLLTMINDSIPFMSALYWSAPTVMGGMAIMFVASVFNLRKLTAGFRRLAEGQTDPQIPPVWCPVLTAATRAALELANDIHETDSAVTNRRQEMANKA